MSHVNIVDAIKTVVQRTSDKLTLTYLRPVVDTQITRIHFEWGHINDINERIIARLKTGENICPLICLFEDYGLDHGQAGLTGVVNLKIIILYYSTAVKTREEREANVFEPVLYPVYNEFLKQLVLSGFFMVADVNQVKHRQINRPHWGDPDFYGNKEYPLKGVFDGIELSNLELKTYLQNCQ